MNDQGSIISVKVTTDNVDDRKPVPEMADELWGFYTEQRLYFWSIGEGTRKQGSDTDNWYKKIGKQK
uniref:hypothetical protein n=1 Tax=Candidatus Enterovibrio escicola TaxID=1927127 RepID=UPI0037440CD9